MMSSYKVGQIAEFFAKEKNASRKIKHKCSDDDGSQQLVEFIKPGKSSFPQGQLIRIKKSKNQVNLNSLDDAGMNSESISKKKKRNYMNDQDTKEDFNTQEVRDDINVHKKKKSKKFKHVNGHIKIENHNVETQQLDQAGQGYKAVLNDGTCGTLKAEKKRKKGHFHGQGHKSLETEVDDSNDVFQNIPSIAIKSDPEKSTSKHKKKAKDCLSPDNDKHIVKCEAPDEKLFSANTDLLSGENSRKKKSKKYKIIYNIESELMRANGIEHEVTTKKKKKNKVQINNSVVMDSNSNSSLVNDNSMVKNDFHGNKKGAKDHNRNERSPKNKKRKQIVKTVSESDSQEESDETDIEPTANDYSNGLTRKRNKKRKHSLLQDLSNEDDVDMESSDDENNSSSTSLVKSGTDSFSRFSPPSEEQKYDSLEKQNRTVFVGNLPKNATKKTLHQIFNLAGDIESVRIRCAVPAKESIPKKIANIRQKYHTEMTSLKGFVVFEDSKDVEMALALNGKVVNGHHIRVDRLNTQPKRNSEQTVFVGNLPFNVEDEVLWSKFSECGTIQSVRVIRDRDTGVGKGFGFVMFKDEDSVAKALSLSDMVIDSRRIRVKCCENTNSNSKNLQKKYGNKTVPARFIHKHSISVDTANPNSRKTVKKLKGKQRTEDRKEKISKLFNMPHIRNDNKPTLSYFKGKGGKMTTDRLELDSGVFPKQKIHKKQDKVKGKKKDKHKSKKKEAL